MRTLEINKSVLYSVEITGKTELLDSDGFKTGEYTTTYGVPTEIRIALYPANGGVVERIFGKDVSLDMVAISNDVILTEKTLLFKTVPVSNYDNTYDYIVSSIKNSINTYNYGLRQRT